MGGEKLCPPYGAHNRSGSPPRGRGKAPARDSTQGGAGITPAWAGKRHKAVLSSGRYGDHPRVGGEKLSVCSGICAGLGSPPRGRGKAAGVLQRNRPAGITPAWAGKRGHLRGLLFSSQDHPRVGGEKAYQASCPAAPRGSPPRGRGKARRRKRRLMNPRITPAWAGKRWNC